MKLTEAVELEVVRRRDDGSGLVRIPIMTAGSYERGMTAGGGKGKATITEAHLSEMASNFAEYPGPLAVNFVEHFEGDGPKPAFVEALEVRGSQLWATLDLNAAAFDQVVVQRAWRGFSVEAERDLKKPTKAFSGWVLTGGVFTNSPALDVHFRVAASESRGERVVHSLSVTVAEGEDMSEEKVSATNAAEKNDDRDVARLTAENTALRSRIASEDSSTAGLRTALASAEGKASMLEVDVNKLRGEVTGLTSKNAALTAETAQLRGKVEALTAQAEAKEIETTSTAVLTICAAAIDKGVKPSAFEGHDKDPVAWLAQSYVTTENLKRAAEAMCGPISLKSATSAGDAPTDAADEPTDGLDDAGRAQLARMGLSASYDGVKTVDDLKRLKTDKE